MPGTQRHHAFVEAFTANRLLDTVELALRRIDRPQLTKTTAADTT